MKKIIMGYSKSSILKITFIALIVLITLILITSCAKSNENNPINYQKSIIKEQQPNEQKIDEQQTDEQKSDTLRGVSLSPKSFEQDDFQDFMAKTKQTGEILMWAGDWSELSGDGAPKTITELASSYNYIPLIEVTHFTQSTGKLIRPLNEKAKQKYLDGAVAFAKKYRPKYFGFGIEINLLYQKSSADFDEFTAFYDEVYHAVKEVSPNTQVFTVFQLEMMKGHTWWSTDKPDPSKAHWFLIDKFDSDLVAFTTYPSLVYKNSQDIPQNYYTEIISHTTKPIVFTEIGWHSAASPAGWESSEEEQAEFIDIFFNLTTDLNKDIVIWSFMFDPTETEPFNSMGLISRDGTTKKSYNRWLSLK